MTRQARTDLRDRMQRVAAKPATHPDTPKRARAASTTPKSARAASSTPKPSRAESTRRPAALAQRRARVVDECEPMPVGRTRLDTLVAWAQWELMSVPRERFHYIKQLLAGDTTGDGIGANLSDDDY